MQYPPCVIMNDKPKSKCSWRLLRWALIGLATIVTLAAVLITEEDWRGRHEWETYQLAAKARGIHFDVASAIPPEVPDDQNFFCAPIVAQKLSGDRISPGNDHVVQLQLNLWRGQIAYQINQSGSWQKGTLTDLKQWQTAFREYNSTSEGKTNGFSETTQPQSPAADVLFALTTFDPAVQELQQACQRPYQRMPLNYSDDFGSAGRLLPWLATMKQCTQLLELRAVAHEQNNQPQPAVDDIKLLLRVNDSVRRQPFLISHLVRLAIMAYVIQPVYEGLAQHIWSDAQLRDLEETLAKQNFLADYQFTISSEMIFGIDTLEKQRITRELRVASGDNGDTVVTNHIGWEPAAFYYQNELAIARTYSESLLPLADPTNRTISMPAYRALQAKISRQTNNWSFYEFHARSTLPAVSRAVTKYAFAQAQVDLAQTACALERYRLANDEYPASLDSLAPRFIETVPHDIINGQPLHYRRTDDGRFLLYSVGLNEQDDGGTVVLTKQGTVDREKGDWVWQYPKK